MPCNCGRKQMVAKRTRNTANIARQRARLQVRAQIVQEQEKKESAAAKLRELRMKLRGM